MCSYYIMLYKSFQRNNKLTICSLPKNWVQNIRRILFFTSKSCKSIYPFQAYDDKKYKSSCRFNKTRETYIIDLVRDLALSISTQHNYIFSILTAQTLCKSIILEDIIHMYFENVGRAKKFFPTVVKDKYKKLITV